MGARQLRGREGLRGADAVEGQEGRGQAQEAQHLIQGLRHQINQLTSDQLISGLQRFNTLK